MENDERASEVHSPTCCRVSEKAAVEHPPSELTSSIPPGADNVQHYIAGIKYSEAQYNQVNLSNETPHAAAAMKIMVLVKQVYVMQSSATPGPAPVRTPCRCHWLTLIGPTKLHQDQTTGGARTLLAERLKTHF